MVYLYFQSHSTNKTGEISVVLMFIDLFIDWENPSRLTSVMLLIDLGKPYKLPVGSRTSSLPLVTAVMFYKILEFL